MGWKYVAVRHYGYVRMCVDHVRMFNLHSVACYTCVVQPTLSSPTPPTPPNPYTSNMWTSAAVPQQGSMHQLPQTPLWDVLQQVRQGMLPMLQC